LLAESGFAHVRVRTLPRRAAHYLAVARARGAGVTGSAAWGAPVTRSDRLIQWFEALLSRLGVDVGEEIVVTGTAGERR